MRGEKGARLEELKHVIAKAEKYDGLSFMLMGGPDNVEPYIRYLEGRGLVERYGDKYILRREALPRPLHRTIERILSEKGLKEVLVI
ncbi:hypothetical protein PABY_24640 [Pyrodictium abyssi]|uniref:Uncharacterized protein n=2 Tax=Pyrodictium abyssi TaxID=54256 RepID=A0ABM8IZC2_9CREN|nr:hypothetical protein PABY_24640 [Pyrodictium abyssi]